MKKDCILKQCDYNLVVVIITALIIAWIDWRVLKTEHFTVIFKPGYEYQAQEILNNLEYYRMKVVDLTGNSPGNLPVVIEDAGILSNGFADPFFYNLHIFTYPPGSGSYLEGTESWYRLVGIHEFTHIAHLTKTSSFTKFLKGIFGTPFQPNMYSPGWLTEGITVYAESQTSPYEGRLNDGFFDNYIAAQVFGDRFPTIIEATNEPLSFPYDRRYLYGGKFFEFLSIRYGSEKFSRFFETYGSYPWAPISAFFPALGLDIAAKKVYGKTFPDLFSEWQEYEKNLFRFNHFTGNRLTRTGWYLSSLLYYRNKLYYLREIPVKFYGFQYQERLAIMEFDLEKKKEKTFIVLNSPLTTNMRLYSDQLYYCTAEIKRAKNVYYNGFGITSILQRVDLKTKKTEVLFKDDIRTFCVLNESLILYVKIRQDKFGSEIWLFTPETRMQLWEVDLLIDEIETNGKWIVVSAHKKFENTDLYIFDAESGNFDLLFKTPWSEGNLCFIDEDCLGFIGNYDGEHRVYGINLNNPDEVFRYTKTGFINSFAIVDSLLFVGLLNHNGFDIYETKYKIEQFKISECPQQEKIGYDSLRLRIKQGSYFDIAKTILPKARLPFFLPLDNSFKKWLYSAIITGKDATGENSYLVLAGYDQLSAKPVFISNFNSLFFSPLTTSLYYNHNNYLNTHFSYPLVYNLGYGISKVATNLHFKSFDGYLRKELTPEISITGRFPYTTYFLNLMVPIEKIFLKSSINRTALKGRIGFNQFFCGGELRTRFTKIYDPQNPDTSI